MDEDVEFRDMIMKNLEKSGYLRKIKAELRANIFEHVKDDVSIINGNGNTENTKLSDLDIALYIVHDLLNNLNLPYTKSVFLSESSINQNTITDVTHQKIAELLQINENNDITLNNEIKKPLLLEFISTHLNNVNKKNMDDEISDISSLPVTLDDTNKENYISELEDSKSNE